MAAVFTRATGVLLVIPFGFAWCMRREAAVLRPRRARRLAADRLLRLAAAVRRATSTSSRPAISAAGRSAIGASLEAWRDFAGTLIGGDPQERAYDLVELFGIVASLATSALLWRRDKALTLYGLATFAVVATSGAALGMHRYALAMPSLFLAPAQLGRGAVFDRVWTLAVLPRTCGPDAAVQLRILGGVRRRPDTHPVTPGEARSA